MKIKCKEISELGKKITTIGAKNRNLTVGKEYIVLVLYIKKGFIEFQIENDEGDIIICSGDQFEILSNYIPSNWEIKCSECQDGSYYLDLAPVAWNNAIFDGETPESYKSNFYEAIIEEAGPLENWRSYPQNQIPDVVKVYLREAEIIYREEEAYEKARLSGFSKPSSILLDLIKGSTSK